MSDIISRKSWRLALVAPAFLMTAFLAESLPAQIAADVIIHNGKLVTVNDEFDIAEALAVLDGKILAVGTDAEMMALRGPTTRMIDLDGRTALPGFYDNHHHIGTGNGDPNEQDWNTLKTKTEVLQAVRQRASEIPAGQWVYGNLQNETIMQQEVPNRWELDKAVPDHPVFLHRGHLSTANSLAMQRAGVSRNSTDPVGGAMVRDSTGEPMGWFREDAGHNMISHAIPAPPPMSDDAKRRGVRDQLAGLLRFGITSVNIPGVTVDNLPWLQGAYQNWGDELPRSVVQIRIRPGYDAFKDPEEGIVAELADIRNLRFFTGLGGDRLKLGAIKMSIDGGFSGGSFWTIPPYPSRPDYHGVIRIPGDIFYRVAKPLHDMGWQIGVHAIGDGAVQMVVDTYERILRENPRTDHRHFIHHYSVMPPAATLKKTAELGILVASHPMFIYLNGPYNAAPALTPERLANNNPQRTLRNMGIHVSFGSDGPPAGPLIALFAAVTRMGIDGKVYGPEERITIEEAIRSHTLESAYMNFEEKNRGSLEVSKVADLVVLSEDILTIDPMRIMDIDVISTIVGGEVLYSSGAH